MATPNPLGPSRGLNVVHLFCHPDVEIDASALRSDRRSGRTRRPGRHGGHLGAKADVCFMVIGENLWDVRRFQSQVQSAGFFVAEVTSR